ncbi:hypothetical protein, partial [Aeromonas hydrophila]|uniref:hypothetical protein n=1 Tax=Aeromonas hydrophila TaxID=644 RepID=UPI002B49FFC2
KTGDGRPSVGSNPTSSAIYSVKKAIRKGGLFAIYTPASCFFCIAHCFSLYLALLLTVIQRCWFFTSDLMAS